MSNYTYTPGVSTCLPLPLGCGELVTDFDNDLSLKEYRISGWCQKCQDEVFAENEFEEEE